MILFQCDFESLKPGSSATVRRSKMDIPCLVWSANYADQWPVRDFWCGLPIGGWRSEPIWSWPITACGCEEIREQADTTAGVVIWCIIPTYLYIPVLCSLHTRYLLCCKRLIIVKYSSSNKFAKYYYLSTKCRIQVWVEEEAWVGLSVVISS